MTLRLYSYQEQLICEEKRKDNTCYYVGGVTRARQEHASFIIDPSLLYLQPPIEFWEGILAIFGRCQSCCKKAQLFEECSIGGRR